VCHYVRNDDCIKSATRGLERAFDPPLLPMLEVLQANQFHKVYTKSYYIFK